MYYENVNLNYIFLRKDRYYMSKDTKNLKDKVAGKAKEVEGKGTGDKVREVEGKAQNAAGKVGDKAKEAAGKVKDKFDKVKDDLKK